MELTGPRGPAGPAFPAKSTANGPANNKGQKLQNDSPEVRATRESQQAITQMNRRVEEAQRDAEIQLDHIRDTYEKKILSENDRNDQAISSEKNRGYEALRNLQKAQQAELSKIKREGEAELSKVRTYYQGAVYNAERDGVEKLSDVQRQQSMAMDYQSQNTEFATEQQRAQHEQLMAQARQEYDGKLADLVETSQTQYNRMHAQAEEATERSADHFKERMEHQIHEQTKVLDDVHARTNAKIQEVRQDTAQKLAAYASRQKDPFYKMMDIGAKLEDEGEGYVLTAKIPEHEQKHVTVAIKGDQLVVSGYRRSEEKLELGPGRVKGTASYQSYHESFPLEVPVDARKLVKAFDGDELTVRVPKKEASYKPHQAPPKPAPARVQKPQFPENIPHVSRNAVGDDEDDRGQVAATRPGSRPLGSA